MGLGHERPDAHRLSIGCVAWVYKHELDRMAAMLSRLGGRGYQVREGTVTYGQCEAEVDPDPDSDLDEVKPHL